MNFRTERDTLGPIEVPAHRLWGAQTQRSLLHFAISGERQPQEILRALALVKQASATVNHALGLLARDKTDAIVAAAQEVIDGLHAQEFPLVVWQTGSGTQTHMNVNEVLANRASELLGGERGEGRKVHPNDDVNRSQSSNDVFPTAMHVAAVDALTQRLLPAMALLRGTLERKARDFDGIVKIGRTHLQDATPLTLGQEVGGWAALIASSSGQITGALDPLRELAIGGTAVGTGLNAPAGFGAAVAAQLSRDTGRTFRAAANPFHALSAHDPLVFASGAVKGLAANLMKIANDIRWLASGPRCGLGEIAIPANEPGSSIMPGKVNPTQAEALTMVVCQVFGNDTTIGLAASQGNFQLNVFKPVLIHAFLQSVTLLADGVRSFDRHCAAGIQPVRERIEANLQRSLMLVTALNPHIGYERAAAIAKKAHVDNLSLREAAVALGLLSGEQFDRLVRPEAMVGPNQPDAP